MRIPGGGWGRGGVRAGTGWQIKSELNSLTYKTCITIPDEATVAIDNTTDTTQSKVVKRA